MKDASDEIIETVKILAPLTKNPNAPNEDKDTPIHNTAFYGHIEVPNQNFASFDRKY